MKNGIQNTFAELESGFNGYEWLILKYFIIM